MFNRTGKTGTTQSWLAVATMATAIMGLSAASHAIPVTYTLTTGSLDSVSLFDLDGPPTICMPGVASCLVSAVAIDSASITVDTATGELLDLSIGISGTGELAMGGLNGYESVSFTGTSFASSVTTSILGGPFLFTIAPPIAGLVEVDTVDLFLTGNPGPIPDFSVPYSGPAAPGGTLGFSPGEVSVTLTGVDIGVFVDPLAPGDPTKVVLAKADFSFSATAPVPEPAAAALYGAGLLVVAAASRRRFVAS